MSGAPMPGRAWRRPASALPPRGVEPLAEVVGRVMGKVSGKRVRVEEQVASAWRQVVSDEVAAQTRPAGLRGGVLTVEVDNSVLLHELAGFHKAVLLDALRELVHRVYVQDLRFRLGPARSAQA